MIQLKQLPNSKHQVQTTNKSLHSERSRVREQGHERWKEDAEVHTRPQAQQRPFLVERENREAKQTRQNQMRPKATARQTGRTQREFRAEAKIACPQSEC